MTSTDELEDALWRSARGLYPAEAAVLLLARALDGTWLRRLDGAGLIEWDEPDQDDPRGPRYARIRWGEAADHPFGASGGETRVLRLACSLAGAAPISLGDAVTGLDRTNLALVLAAIAHANGSHEHKDTSWLTGALTAAAPGAPVAVTPPGLDAPYLPPVFPWPGEETAAGVEK